MAEETAKKPEEGKKRRLPKGRHRSAIKRHRQSLKRRQQNRAAKAALRDAVKKVAQAVSQKDAGLAESTLRKAVSLLHKGGRKRVLRKGNASRKIARLSSLVARMGAAKQGTAQPGGSATAQVN